MSALKILQIHNHYREGGGEDTVVGKEAAVLRSAGHTVIEYHVDNPTELFGAATSLLVSPWNPAAARRIRAIVAENLPDVAHVHNTWWALTPSILRALDGLCVPVVVTLHNYRLLCVNAQLFRDGGPCEDCVGTHPWRGVRHRCYRDSYVASAVSAAAIQSNRWLNSWHVVDRLLVLTDFARSRFLSAGLPPERLHIKSNFVSDPGPRDGSPSSSRTVLFVGRLSIEKGIRQLLDAWGAAKMGDLTLVVVGDGPLRPSLEARSPANVRFIGRLPGNEVEQLMLSSRAMIFPSVWYEGQPMVLLEALAAGLPLIASDIGGVPETIADTRAAMLATPGDPASWVSALEHLENAAWVDGASSAARAVFEDRYTPEIGLRRLIDEYHQAMANRSI